MKKKKIIIFYISAFFILFAGCFLVEYIISNEKPSPIYLIREGFFEYITVFPLAAFFPKITTALLFFKDMIILVLIGLCILTGIAAPVFLSLKKNKLFPYNIVFILSLAAYFFVGLLCFGLRYGEL